MSTEIAISARRVTVKFGPRTILNNLNLDIYPGEVTALLGPNGAGKSTLLKVLCAETSSSAQLSYFGTRKADWPAGKLARHMGMLPQHSTLTFPFLAHEVVELGAIPLQVTNKEARHIAHENMCKTGVEHLASRSYPSLSGGEKQRLHLARVLTQLHHSGTQKILMLDEPTSALDLAHQHKTLAIARTLAKKEQCAVVVVLHDLNLASQYADRILMLHQGDIICDADPWHALLPERIEEVYGFHSLVAAHPTLGFPQVHPRA